MPRNRRLAVFLDRDGVVNASPGEGFVTDWKRFRFLPGSLEALRLLRRKGRTVIVVTNQSGVGRGLMSISRLAQINRRMRSSVRQAGGCIAAVYACPHWPGEGCPCRKPGTALLRRAARRFRLDLRRCVVVGDDERDIRMGKKAGCRTILVLTGKQGRRSAGRMATTPDRVVRDLRQAAREIVSDP